MPVSLNTFLCFILLYSKNYDSKSVCLFCMRHILITLALTSGKMVSILPQHLPFAHLTNTKIYGSFFKYQTLVACKCVSACALTKVNLKKLIDVLAHKMCLKNLVHAALANKQQQVYLKWI